MEREEILLRQLTNHHLLEPVDKLSAARDLCGFQAQFLSNALHGLKIRSSGRDKTPLNELLVKNWTLRGTVHIFAREDLPLFVRCNGGRLYRKNEWSAESFWNRREDWDLSPERQAFFSSLILSALESGPRPREELKTLCRQAGMSGGEEHSMFHPWGGGIRELCQRGFINYELSESKEFSLAPVYEPMGEDEAWLELARRYFTSFGPATVKDAAYFFGLPQRQVKRWLSMLPLSSCRSGERTYYHIETGRDHACRMPGCLFLAGFDQLLLGYDKKESLYLPQERLRDIFSLSGIVTPSILLHGRIEGRWKMKDRRLRVELFSSLPKRDTELIRESAERLWEDLKDISFAE